MERLVENDFMLTELNFSHKMLTDDNIIKLGQGLEENKTVKKLYLSHTRLTDRGGEALLASLQANQSINWIRIKNTSLSPEILTKITSLIEKRG